jgi:hypothetical protein
LAIFFTGIGGLPPAGLTNAGGLVNISNTGPGVGAVQEANCSNATCVAAAPPSRSSTAGVVIGSPVTNPVPTLSEWSMIALGMALAVVGFLRVRRATA